MLQALSFSQHHGVRGMSCLWVGGVLEILLLYWFFVGSTFLGGGRG
jgi:hypothetical protein